MHHLGWDSTIQRTFYQVDAVEMALSSQAFLIEKKQLIAFHQSQSHIVWDFTKTMAILSCSFRRNWSGGFLHKGKN